MTTKITYTVYYNCVTDFRYRNNWQKFYEFLSEDDMKLIAIEFNGIKKENIEKLIKHKNDKFNMMGNRKAIVYKVFHEFKVETISYKTQRKELISNLTK
jgi:hypothetical protein